MELTIVGSAPAWAIRPAQPSSSYLVELGDDAILLDLGQGSLGMLHAWREPSTLRAVVISHLHPDHHVDLVALRHLLRYGYADERHVELCAPPGLRARYDAFLGEPGFLDGLPGEDLSDGSRTLGAFRLTALHVRHAEESFAFRVEAATTTEQPGLVYSGDCGHAEDLVPLLRSGDTLLCEAYWGVRDPIAGAAHLSASEAAHVARACDVGRLVLTHIADAHDPQSAAELARSIYPGPVQLAEPGVRVTVG